MGNTCCTDEINQDTDARNRMNQMNPATSENRDFTEHQTMRRAYQESEPASSSRNNAFGARSKAQEERNHGPTKTKAIKVNSQNALSPDAKATLETLPRRDDLMAPKLPVLGPYHYMVSGESYIGQYFQGRRQGYGEAVLEDGSIYQGKWQDDVRRGYGRMVNSDGSVYDGYWESDKPHGKGKLVYSDGNGYEGDWREGQISGKGVQTWADNSRYEGQFKNGIKHGFGKFTWPDGNVYEGEYANDMRHGKGVFTW